MENLIHDLTLVNSKVDSLGMVFQHYTEYNKDDKKFLEYLKELKEEHNVEQGTATESSK